MLAFTDCNDKNSRCIAKVIGGKLDKQKLYVVNPKHSKKYQTGKTVIVEDGILQPIPNIKTREIPYVAGPSGSGKSTWASKFAELYHKLHPDNEIYIFSRVAKDPAFDKLHPVRVPVDESLVADPIDIMEEIEDHDLVIFDDCDTITDDKVKKAISKVKNDILETGRHKNICCIVTSHLINGNDRKDSRTILNECHNLTIFPASGGAYGIKYALKNYWGMGAKDIDKIMKLPSRWVTISKNYPQYVLYEKGSYIL
jgi:energy-coupling factor transporter ATP-binding protein EcfA2